MESLYQLKYSSMEETKAIFTTASDSQPATTNVTESVTTSDNKVVVNGQKSVFSPFAAPFQSRYTSSSELLSLVTPQEPREADPAPSCSDIDELLLNIRLSEADALFETQSTDQNPRNYLFAGSSRAESVGSSRSNIWADSPSNNVKNLEAIENFEFFVKSLSSANNYVSMLTREQLAVLQSFRPGLLYEFLQEVVRVRSEKRMRRVLPNECAFCKNNGENEEVYSTHALKDWRGRVECPVLRAFHCPRCGATGDHAHTIKYCQRNANGLDRTGSFMRRRMTPNGTVLLSEGSRGQSYSAPPTPAGTPSAAQSSLNNSSFWSNFSVN